MNNKDKIMKKFHNKAEFYAKEGDSVKLQRIVLNYQLFRETNAEPFENSDNQMASIIENHIKNKRGLH